MKREVFYTEKRNPWTGGVIRTKRYRVRRKDGTIKDIQSFKRAHGQDIKRRAKAERACKK